MVDGIVLIDTAGLIRLVNPSVQKLFGYLPEEVLGQNVKILMPAPWREAHDGYLERYRTTGEARIIGNLKVAYERSGDLKRSLRAAEQLEVVAPSDAARTAAAQLRDLYARRN